MKLRSSWLDLTPRMLLVLPSIALYQRPGHGFPRGPDAGVEEGPEELVGHHAIVAEPVGVRPLERARSRVPVEAGVDAELPTELVADVPEDGVLVRVEHGPQSDRVDQFRGAKPPLEEHHDPVRPDVVAAVDGALVPEVIGEGLLAGHLVHVPHQRVPADGQLAGASPSDEEALAGVEHTPGLHGHGRRLRALWGRARRRGTGWRLRRCGRAGGCDNAQLKLPAAAVRDPHAVVVVAPGLAEQAGGLAVRSCDGDTSRGVGRAVLPLARLRRAGHGRGLGQEPARQRHEQDGRQRGSPCTGAARGGPRHVGHLPFLHFGVRMRSRELEGPCHVDLERPKVKGRTGRVEVNTG